MVGKPPPLMWVLCTDQASATLLTLRTFATVEILMTLGTVGSTGIGVSGEPTSLNGRL